MNTSKGSISVNCKWPIAYFLEDKTKADVLTQLIITILTLIVDAAGLKA